MAHIIIRKLTNKDTALASFRFYDLLVHIFVVVLLISNLVAPKLTQLGIFHLFGRVFPVEVSGAQLLFPITYIFGDIFTEVYGYAGSRRAIWVGFFSSLILAIMAKITVLMPPAPGWHDQAAFATVFNMVPRFVAASLIAFWAGEFANSYILAKMKIWTGGKYLWTRTVGSTVVGQAVDTTLVMIIAFGGTVSWGTILTLIYSGYFAKVIYEVVATPLTYLVVNSLKRAEGVDVYDTQTNFSPFATETQKPAASNSAVGS
jgi:uncharacterized integral membrane protein (TIGR00697 family)